MTTPEITQLDANFSYAPQIEPEAMSAISAAGYRSVLNARPDGEGGEAQPTSHALELAAKAQNLDYAHVPVVPSDITEETVNAFVDAVARLPKPILGFCLSGKRAARLYQMTLE